MIDEYVQEEQPRKCHHSDCGNYAIPGHLFCETCAALHADDNPIVKKTFSKSWILVPISMLVLAVVLYYYDYGIHKRPKNISVSIGTMPPVFTEVDKPIDEEEVSQINAFWGRRLSRPEEDWSLVMRSTGKNFDYCVSRTHKDMTASNGDGLMMRESVCKRTLSSAINAIDNGWDIDRKEVKLPKQNTPRPVFKFWYDSKGGTICTFSKYGTNGITCIKLKDLDSGAACYGWGEVWWTETKTPCPKWGMVATK